MKKFLAILVWIFAAALSFSSHAAEDKASLKARFEKNVTKAENGDVIISGFQKPENLKDPSDIGMAFVMCLAYIDPELDFDNLSDSINKAVGKKRTPNGGRPIASIMDGISKYLGRKNMNLQQVRLSGVSAKQKLDAGLPIFCWTAVSPIYNGALKERSQKRADTSDIKTWAKDLRKLEQRKIKREKSTYTQCIIAGYNKASDEYRILGVSEIPIWITEKELKNLLLDAYIVRF